MTEREVKKLVAHAFAELGAKGAFDVKETLFLEGGQCLAVAYRAQDLSAVWCLADNVVEFRDGEGKLLRTRKEPSSSAA